MNRRVVVGAIVAVVPVLGCGAESREKRAPPPIAAIEVVDHEPSDEPPTPTPVDAPWKAPTAPSGTPAVSTGFVLAPGGPITFGYNSAKLEAASDPALQGLSSFLQANPDVDDAVVVVELISPGNPAYMLKLTEERAKSISAWLVSDGVPKTMLHTKGLGGYCVGPLPTSPPAHPVRVTVFVFSRAGAPTGATCGCPAAAQQGVTCP